MAFFVELYLIRLCAIITVVAVFVVDGSIGVQSG
jgi:hypothetical protein